MNPVILSLTTVPIRLHDPQEHCGIRPGLKTLVEQTASVPYEVHLNIPYSYNYCAIDLPEWMVEWQERYPHLKIHRCVDLGPITKIYHTIQRVTDPDTIIISVDDDLFYCDGLIDAHLVAREKYPDWAIGYAGMSSIEPRDIHFATTVRSDTRVRLLEGYKTISYKRSFFDADLDMFVFKHWNDDIAISAYLGYKNIKKMVLAYEHETDFRPRVESFPVIGHTPISGEKHACNIFRNSPEILESSEKISNSWYAAHWLER